MAEEQILQAKGHVDRELLGDYVSALKTIRSVRGAIVLLLILSLLIPLACFGGVQWGKIRQPATATAADLASDDGAPVEDAFGISENRLYTMAQQAMRFTPFVARLMTLMLIFVYLMTTNICLSGRLGGANDSIVSFFWAVLLMLLLIPWQSWIGAGEGVAVFYDLDALINAHSSLCSEWLVRLAHYVRFLLFPFLGLLTVVVADIRFGRCYRLVMQRVRQRLESAVR